MLLKRSKVLCRQAKNVITSDCLVRSKHSKEGFELQAFGQTPSKSCYHQSQVQKYPATKPLPLPTNIEDLPSSEKLKFSPQRNREINGSVISTVKLNVFNDIKSEFTVCETTECYDCSGVISLSSAMQTNVPYPFVSKGKPTHLNMPGGQWGQNEKYTSEDLNNVHHSNMKNSQSLNGGTCSLGFKKGNKNSYMNVGLKQFGNVWPIFNINQYRTFCTGKEHEPNVDSKKEPSQLSGKEKLKIAVRDYGAVVVVFHVGISLVSLGCCYLVVASGVDLTSVIEYWGINEGAASAGIAAQFVIAYAVHKAMAPGRIIITLTSVPFVVKKLRKIGFLKPPKPKAK